VTVEDIAVLDYTALLVTLIFSFSCLGKHTPANIRIS